MSDFIPGLVSVIVPSYNHAAYLERRLQSILTQTYQQIEVIILDDFSTDNSRIIINKLKAQHPSIQTVFNKENSGSISGQWSKGIELARGEYLWIAESDDFAQATFLDRLVAVLAADPSLGLAYCASDCLFEDGRIEPHWMEDVYPERWKQDFKAVGIEECRQYLVLGNTIPNSSAVLFRHAAYKQAGGVSQQWRFCGDWDLWMRILYQNNIAYLAERLSTHRQHQKSFMGKLANKPERLLEYYRFKFQAAQFLGVENQVYPAFYKDLFIDFYMLINRGQSSFLPRLWATFASVQRVRWGLLIKSFFKVAGEFFSERV